MHDADSSDFSETVPGTAVDSSSDEEDDVSFRLSQEENPCMIERLYNEESVDEEDLQIIEMIDEIMNVEIPTESSEIIDVYLTANGTETLLFSQTPPHSDYYLSNDNT